MLRNEIIGEFKWPTKKLPQQLQVGETVVIKINTAQIEKEEEYSKMRKLLEELIN